MHRPRCPPTGVASIAGNDDNDWTETRETRENQAVQSVSPPCSSMVGVLIGLLLVVVLTPAFLNSLTQPVMPSHQLCEASSVAGDSTVHLMRTKIGKPGGFGSCAVVGSAGFLRLQRLGEEIDAHEFIVRANLAPVGGFEHIVGRRTSMRVLNSEAIGTILYEKQCSNDTRVRETMCPPYPIYLNTADRALVKAYRRLCPDVVVFDEHDINAWDPALHAQWQGLGVNLMSGSYAIAISLKMCPNGTTVYGVSHEGTFLLNNNNESTYHYFDSQKQSAKDSLPKSAAALSTFAQTQGSCLLLHSPTKVEAVSALPSSSLVRDTLVDDVAHDKEREFYMSHRRGCSRVSA